MSQSLRHLGSALQLQERAEKEEQRRQNRDHPTDPTLFPLADTTYSSPSDRTYLRVRLATRRTACLGCSGRPIVEDDDSRPQRSCSTGDTFLKSSSSIPFVRVVLPQSRMAPARA